MTPLRTAGLVTLLMAGLAGCAQHGMMKHEGAQGMGGMVNLKDLQAMYDCMKQRPQCLHKSVTAPMLSV